MFPASAIVSLSEVAVSKTPPIDVAELEVEPRLLPWRLLDCGLSGMLIWGKGYWFDGGEVKGDSKLSGDRLEAGEDMSMRW